MVSGKNKMQPRHFKPVSQNTGKEKKKQIRIYGKFKNKVREVQIY